LDKMFRKDREYRPTIDRLKRHKFFKGIDWDSLARHELPPPLQPRVVPPEKEYDSDIVFSKVPPYEGDDPFHYVDKSLEDFSASPDLPSPLPFAGIVSQLSPSLSPPAPFTFVELLETVPLSTPSPALSSFGKLFGLSPMKSGRVIPALDVPAPYAPSLEVPEEPPLEPVIPIPSATNTGASLFGAALAWFLDGYRQLCCQLCT
jgi:hypothetical protein